MDNHTHKLIELRAYEIWQYRQEFDVKFVLDRLGEIREITELDDWLMAEQEVMDELKEHAQTFKERFEKIEEEETV